MDRDILKQRLYLFLRHEPKKPAKALAQQFNVSKSLINSILYSEDCFFSIGDNPPLWCVLVQKDEPPKPEYIQPNDGEGLLSHLGYRVGVNGKLKPQRWRILDRIMTKELPKFSSAFYMHEWGEINSQERLIRLAGQIAVMYNTHDNKRYSEARRDWKTDHEYLKQKYWDGNSNWPDLYG